MRGRVRREGTKGAGQGRRKRSKASPAGDGERRPKCDLQEWFGCKTLAGLNGS